ncbi:TPA: TIGR00289 family protein, partial [Candidatus Bathyarchaeota archaeon]|nr:TIGR00289 family protein [Candidatus Bathyarchaeota archaeon]
MKLGVLFSGGKDSTFALHMASEREEIACLIAMLSKNEESYMFHTPNIDITALQAEAMELPILQ